MADPGGNFGGEGGAPGSRGGPTGGRGGQPEGSVEATEGGLPEGRPGRVDRSALEMGFGVLGPRQYDPTMSQLMGTPVRIPATGYPAWGPWPMNAFEQAMLGATFGAVIPGARFIPGLGRLAQFGLEKFGMQREAPTFANRMGAVTESQARAMATAGGGVRGGPGFEGGTSPSGIALTRDPAAEFALQLAQQDPGQVLARLPTTQLPAAQTALKELEMRLRLFRHLLAQRLPSTTGGRNA